MQILQTTYTLQNIAAAASALWKATRPHRVLTFSGDLGAGKTTLISNLCTLLEVNDATSSPTFSLVNEYRYWKDDKEETIYHIDWYRLKSTDEAVDAGMEEYLKEAKAGEAFCLIEWPEKAWQLLPRAYIAVDIITTGEETREMTVTLVNKP